MVSEEKMTRTIVLDGHTLGVIYPHTLQILKASVLRGSHHPPMGTIAFDPVLQAGRFRAATEQDFQDFGVMFSPHYLEPVSPEDYVSFVKNPGE